MPRIPQGEERNALLHRYGDIVASLGGSFITSSDVGTGESDMDVIADRTEHVFGRSVAKRWRRRSEDQFTAVGVFHGIKASLAHVHGSGRSLGQDRAGSGCRQRRRRAGGAAQPRRRPGARRGRRRRTSADDRVGRRGFRGRGERGDCHRVRRLRACALGATLSAESVPQLRCRIVAGSANNQLAQPKAADLLRAAGILYAPDYVINAGGAIAINFLELNERSRDDVDAALVGIGDTLRKIYARADSEGITTAAAADALAASRLT